MKIEWKKIKPMRVRLVHDTWLEYEENGEKKSVFACKDKPIDGTVSMAGYKKIGKNNVKFYYFRPDICHDERAGYALSAKWFKDIPDKGDEKDLTLN